MQLRGGCRRRSSSSRRWSDGKPITARGPGLRDRRTSTWSAPSPNIGRYLAPRDFDPGRFFTHEEDQRGAHVAVIGYNVARVAVSRRRRGGPHVHDGRRRVHGGRRLSRKPRAASSARTARTTQIDIPLQTARDALSAGRPLHDHRQGEARHAARRPIDEVRGHHAPHPPPAHRRAGRFRHLHAGPDHPAVRPDHRADRPGGDRHLRRWACWWAASA